MNRVSDYLHARASKNKIPLNGTFELSPVCNFACKMCYVRRTPAQIEAEGKRLRTWTEWLELAKECREAGMLYLLLTGGEPFIYPHFRELYGELHRMGFVISINSNGTMIDRETVEWLKTMAPSRINITLYGGSAETYGRVCGQPGGYERVVQAIDMLKEAGIPVVINASMIPENAEDLEAIMSFGKARGLNTRVATYMFPPARREQEESDSRFTPEESAAINLRKQHFYFPEEENWRKYLREQLAKVQDAETSYEVDDKDTWGTDLEYMKCRAGRSSFWISWDGSMTACGLSRFPVVQYPFEDSFAECWMILTDAVRTIPVLRGCSQCPRKELCRPCVAMIQTETGDINAKAPYLCSMVDCVIDGMRDSLRKLEE